MSLELVEIDHQNAVQQRRRWVALFLGAVPLGCFRTGNTVMHVEISSIVVHSRLLDLSTCPAVLQLCTPLIYGCRKNSENYSIRSANGEKWKRDGAHTACLKGYELNHRQASQVCAPPRARSRVLVSGKERARRAQLHSPPTSLIGR